MCKLHLRNFIVISSFGSLNSSTKILLKYSPIIEGTDFPYYPYSIFNSSESLNITLFPLFYLQKIYNINYEL